MQFRDQGRRVQVLAYRGYDRERRRGVVKLLGSFDRFSTKLPDTLLSSVTDDEKIELQAHFNSLRQKQEDNMSDWQVKELPKHIASVSDSLTSGQYDCHINAEYAIAVYAGMDRLAKALRKAGFKRTMGKAEPGG